MKEEALLDLFRAMEGILGPNYECRYYPCHFSGQDCSFCFCPFYPCFLYRLGGEIIVSSKGNYVWSCKNCWWIHEKQNVEAVVNYFSGYSRQILIEEDWYFFNRSLQNILFGEELGLIVNGSYDLMPPNFYELEYLEVDKTEFLAVKLDDFEIKSVRKIKDIEEAENEILIPEKEGRIIRGKYKGLFVECRI
ncbi:hypothetical protein DRP04_13795 [Archaeoglobales archaeon]|nr:MAG: hypothetical protein DRP04_13795 [Archaeoglobales archaeon]